MDAGVTDASQVRYKKNAKCMTLRGAYLANSASKHG